MLTDSIWKLNNKTLEVVREQEHLGVIRLSNNLETHMADERIKVGRRTAFSLFGAGFHGLNGLKPKTSVKIWKKYIVSRLVHGLEVTINPEKDLEKLENYQRATLKQLQHLPPSTSNCATYLISGVLPIRAEIEKRTLTTFVRFISNTETAEYAIIKRQLVMKTLKSKSWTTEIKKLLHRFRLPSAHSLMDNIPTKENWKLMVKKAVHSHYLECLKN